ncbi:MAG: hypothetical protein HXS53_01655 [Theionarchaea archaeon]|nr:hypothetical protein [Theionarchaea archaeon]
MFEKYAMIGTIIRICNGRIKGRKKIQKMIYIAQKLEYPFKERFSLYRYGPYSLELAGELKRMGELFLLLEDKRDLSYLIELTDRGNSFSENFKNEIISMIGKKEFIQFENLIMKLNNLKAWQLEILATLFYFREVEQRDYKLLEDVVAKIKPRFNPEKIHEMALIMKDLIQKFSLDQ